MYLKLGFQSCDAENARPPVPLSVTGFSARMSLIRAENPVGARSAQGRARQEKQLLKWFCSASCA
jgi:hypothetical protein